MNPKNIISDIMLYQCKIFKSRDMKNRTINLSTNYISWLRLLFLSAIIMFSYGFSQAEEQSPQAPLETISGLVIDEKGEPIIGATVLELGSTRGTQTDLEGRFSLRTTLNSILKISYIGYTTQEVKAVNDLTVTLKENSTALDEIVVVGYGQQKKVNLTGAVSTVDIARNLDGRPQQDVSKALQGTVPGLSVVNTQGGINNEPTLSIRGVGTLSNNAQSAPYILVDGVPMDDISFLNTQDIQSISVLKDAASSSIYGARAAFGVILITTKSAKKAEKLTVSYSNNFAWSSPTYLPDYPDVPTQLHALSQANNRAGIENELFGMYLDTMLPYAEAWKKQNNGKKASYREMRPFQSWDDVGDYFVNPDGTGAMYYADWDVQNIMFRKWTPSMSHNISVQGSSGKTNFYASFGYNSKDGVLKFNTDNLKKYNVNANINYNLTSWLQSGIRFNYSDKKYTQPNTRRSTYTYLWRWGSFFGPYGTINGIDARNDIAYLKQAADAVDNTSFTKLSAYIKANVTKDISINADYTFDITNRNYSEPGFPVTFYNTWGGNLNSPTTVNSGTGTYMYESNAKETKWTLNVYGNYSHSFGLDHNINIMIGANGESELYRFFWAKRTNLYSTDSPQLSLAYGTQTAGNSASQWSAAGYFGRINYDWRGIWLLELNGRYDGSSRFPKNDHWAFFPSASIGYRFSEEKYFEKYKSTINNGKLRFSYGEIGNQAVGNYMFLSTIAPISIGNTYWLDTDGNKVAALGAPTYVDPLLSWERIETIDIGFDIGLFNDQVSLTFDWFQRTTRDMLAPGKAMPATLGTEAPYTNSGSLRTQGWELNLSLRHKFGEWDTYATFNLSDATSKVTKWNDGSRLLNSYYSGMTYGDIWGFETERYFTENDFNADGSYKNGVASQTTLEQGTFHYGPGDIKFKDLNNDGVINGGKGTAEDHGDLKVIGNYLPRYEYSFHVGTKWRGFDVDCFFQGVGKRSQWTQSAFVMPFMRGADAIYSNQTSYNYYDYSTGTYHIDQNNEYPIMYPGNAGYGTISVLNRGNNNFYPQTRYLVNMAYLRFKNFTIGYTIPNELVRKAYLSKLRLYFSAENICNIIKKSKYPIDPEVNTSESSTDLANGTWGRVAPITRTISFGIQATF